MTKKNTPVKRNERAAAALREQQRQEARRRNTMYAVVAGVLVLVLVGGFLWMRSTNAEVDAPAAGSANGLTIGDPDAPHTVVIYEDFLCPYCGELEAATRDGLAEAAADGKAYVEYRPFVLLSRLGDYSERSTNAFAVVLEESGPDVAKQFHDLLFENQPEETAAEFPDNDQLVAWAVEAGADEEAVRSGLETLGQKAWVDAATKAATDAGVPGTPYIELDGEQFQDGSTMADIGNSLVDAVQ